MFIGSMKKFKIVYGFGEGEYLAISGNELHKAIALFMEKNGRAIFENGAIRGQDIMRIVPDWHAVRGWNKSWGMTPDDFEDIKPLEADYKEAYRRASYLAEFAIKENRRDLLLKPASEAIKEVPQLEKQNPISEATKLIADKMKMD